MKKIFLLAIVFFMMFGAFAQANEKGEESFFVSSSDETPSDVVVYDDLAISFDLKNKKGYGWKSFTKITGEYADNIPGYTRFLSSEKNKTANIHVYVSEDKDFQQGISEEELVSLVLRDAKAWYKKNPSKEWLVSGNPIPICVNGEKRTPALFMESRGTLKKGVYYQTSFILTFFEGRKVFFVIRNFKPVEKDGHRGHNHEEIVQEIFPRVIFSKNLKIASI